MTETQLLSSIANILMEVGEQNISPQKYQYYENLLHKRTIIYNSEIMDDIVEWIYIPLKNFEEDDCDDPVTLILSTPGGSIFDSLFLTDYLHSYKKKLNIICLGNSMSMGTLLLAGAGGNPNITRMCYPKSFFLFHPGSIGLEDNTDRMSAQEIMEFDKHVDKITRDMVIERTKITPELYDAKKHVQWYMTGEEALKYGLVDKVIGVDAK